MAEFPPLADAEILAARGARDTGGSLDPAKPYAFFVEPERMRHFLIEQLRESSRKLRVDSK